MSRFYGSLQGTRGEATRQGSANSGLRAHIRGWDVGIKVYAKDVNGKDVFDVYVSSGSNGKHSDIFIGTAGLDENGKPTFQPA